MLQLAHVHVRNQLNHNSVWQYEVTSNLVVNDATQRLTVNKIIVIIYNNNILSTTTITIYYYSARKLILIYRPTEDRRPS